ncbi:hypothetical protein [Pseudomonas nitroreducens]|uniref:Uncharacterized protein n=1 Tax=Pseudomonas nitroreducens TaxID=46680 RepID=A0A6G6IUV4_PSENT|nr:hypothetical protein [Pseudomonas nitroreducens]QIE86747.1 hypothetical protein G5B91_10870 [Pseudomonas nitroreducens]
MKPWQVIDRQIELLRSAGENTPLSASEVMGMIEMAEVCQVITYGDGIKFRADVHDIEKKHWDKVLGRVA